jgi:hypothetical protein
MLDSPTNNFATWTTVDALNSSGLQDGGLRIEPNPSNRWRASIAPSSGKWYYEIYNEYQHHSTIAMGVKGLGTLLSDVSDAVYVMHPTDFTLYNGGSTVGSFGTMGGEKIIGVAYDVDAQTISFYHNGSAIHATLTDYDYSGMSNSEWVAPYLNIGQGRRVRANFGQDSSFAGTKTAQGNQDSGGVGDFYYTPPSGFLALCSANLPSATVIPSKHFNTVTYAGNSTNSRAISDVGFQPNLTWIKTRSHTWDHGLFDSVRGSNKRLRSNITAAEDTSASGYISTFNSSGFTLVHGGSNYKNVNQTGYTYVAWNWKGGGTAVLNENGTIDSQVSANVDAGFSIVSYTGTGSAGATIGHGLNSAPEMVIVKTRDSIGGYNAWAVQHSSIGAGYLILDSTQTSDPDTVGGYWNNTQANSSVITVGGYDVANDSGSNFIAYCFHSVDGYSKVGSYTGNGSTDGTFVYTGFRPAYVMVKSSSFGNSETMWSVWDSKRPSYNPSDLQIYANSGLVEGQREDGGGAEGNDIDFTANGFKLRDSPWSSNASSGATYVFLAFAEMPFKHSNAR